MIYSIRCILVNVDTNLITADMQIFLDAKRNMKQLVLFPSLVGRWNVLSTGAPGAPDAAGATGATDATGPHLICSSLIKYVIIQNHMKLKSIELYNSNLI